MMGLTTRPGLAPGACLWTGGLGTGDVFLKQAAKPRLMAASVLLSLSAMVSHTAWAQALPEPAPYTPARPAAGIGAAGMGLSTYPLGAGDVISIRVFGEPEFTKEKIRLTDAGTIFYPSIGEIRIKGITLGELEQIIINGLKGRILVDPQVSVEINEYRPFFITGMVRNPGSYQYQPGLTVRKATSLAGGLRERASVNKIFVIRERDASQTPAKVDLDTSIGPGDLITVEESFF